MRFELVKEIDGRYGRFYVVKDEDGHIYNCKTPIHEMGDVLVKNTHNVSRGNVEYVWIDEWEYENNATEDYIVSLLEQILSLLNKIASNRSN